MGNKKAKDVVIPKKIKQRVYPFLAAIKGDNATLNNHSKIKTSSYYCVHRHQIKKVIGRQKKTNQTICPICMPVACNLHKFKKVYKIKVNFGSDEFKGY